MRFRLVPVLVGALLVLVAPAPPTTAQVSIEWQVFSLINGARSSGFIAHAGLMAATRGHSQDMAARDSMDHDGVDRRMRNVAPDPAEANGAPDDGTTGYEWCENVTYVTGFPEGEVADRIYHAWVRSAAHHRCMTNTSMNTAGIGVYYDGTTWWATFAAMIDRTPPGGSAPTARQDTGRPAAPVTDAQQPAVQVPSEPTASQAAPEPARRPRTPEVIERQRLPAPETRIRSHGVTIELRVDEPLPDLFDGVLTKSRPHDNRSIDAAFAALGAIALASLGLHVRRRRALPEWPAEMEGRDDVAFAEVEAMGTGSLESGVEGDAFASRFAGDPEDVVIEGPAVALGPTTAGGDEVIDVQDPPVDEVRLDPVPGDSAAFAGVV